MIKVYINLLELKIVILNYYSITGLNNSDLIGSLDPIYLGTSFQEVLLIKLLGIVAKNFINIDNTVGYYINVLNSKFQLKDVSLECMLGNDSNVGVNKTAVKVPKEFVQELVQILPIKEETTSNDYLVFNNDSTEIDLTTTKLINITGNVNRNIMPCDTKNPLCHFQYSLASNVSK